MDLGDARQLPKEDVAGAMRVLRAPEASTVRRICGGAAPDHHGFEKVKEEVERKDFKMSVTESGKERKSKMIASCGCVNAANDDRQCRNAWSGFENESKKVGGQRISEEEEVQGEILAYQEEQSLPKELYEGGCQESVTCRYDAGKDVASSFSGDGPHRKIYN